jgi:hypothetical protein
MFQDLRYRMRALFERKAMEIELAEELRFHFVPGTRSMMRLAWGASTVSKSNNSVRVAW